MTIANFSESNLEKNTNTSESIHFYEVGWSAGQPIVSEKISSKEIFTLLTSFEVYTLLPFLSLFLSGGVDTKK